MVRCESRPSTIGHITLGTKQTGAPSAGNPHAGCDVAGAGNGFTVWLLRHSQRKRGETARPDLRNTAPVLDPTGFGELTDFCSESRAQQMQSPFMLSAVAGSHRSVVVKMRSEQDSGLPQPGIWFRKIGSIHCRSNRPDGYAAVPRKGSTRPPRCVRSRKSAQSCIILARGSR